jgi:hypothetical protein
MHSKTPLENQQRGCLSEIILIMAVPARVAIQIFHQPTNQPASGETNPNRTPKTRANKNNAPKKEQENQNRGSESQK